MDKIAYFRECIQTLLTHYAKDDISTDDVEVQLIFDTQRDHYQWLNVGWQQFERIYRCIIHFDIKNGKIWLQQNLTDQNPAEDLVNMGIPKDDIVLGLQPPYKRPYTEYGVA
ncbi:XisI protein [Aphanothece hegewaldii CCALA 016]|uniref:XisI protein n=1 Tax=Aphanothece hegewaldii CCALA 016 TaxID=2107694 RepID=A0A2T1M0T7_9CHRO|nr:XisI protein [Aphanothece hegewaldii]PSF38291.1 XisI protein [Aphanothece hegewaldii CCALA 016]